ncbi:trihelix transcription factor ENAP1-like [Prosopis cineraria]|uniref:trihelix transcription factor ENAP1-like n=1 Tax=Prosopis cineraria TaxID=364024 RepID=UPI00240F1751|nr:trihelix transcription factor ENAP1-like [Prosopis cineraria]
MDDTKDDVRYPSNMYGDKNHQGYGYLNHKKHSVRSSPYSQPVTGEYVEDNDDDEDGEDVELLGDEEDEDVDQSNNIYSQNDVADNDYEEDAQVEDDDENHGNNNNNDDGNDGDGDDDNENHGGKKKSYKKRVEDDSEWHPKKRKLKSLISAYEVAPRVPAAPSAAAHSAQKPYFGSRNSLTDWTEHETFVLLDAWGNRFLQQGRKSLRSEQWQEVAEEVSEVSKIERTDTQCRNRLDTLKKMYKKEKAKLAEMVGGSSKWVYFKRMDKLLSSPPQNAGLSCGLDSGEYVFMNPRVYLNRANGLDEMRDSPGNSESTGEDEGLDGLHAKKRRHGRDSDETSFRLLAESIQKFGETYEKIENSKRQQMVELEKMRMDFQRELETQKRQILERLQSEIAKLQQRDNEENDDSVEKDE